MLPLFKSLQFIHENALRELISVNDIQDILGIGSYFKKNTKYPHDIDYIIFKKSFRDLNIKILSKIFESIKSKYKNGKLEPLINIFIEDVNGNKLNSVDLWFILNFDTETLDDCIADRKNQIWINRGAVLLYSN